MKNQAKSIQSARKLQASLFAFAGEKTYARFKVWKDSARSPVAFHPLGANRQDSRRVAARLYHHARHFERRTRRRGHQDGALGRNALAVLHALLFDFLNLGTGRLDPGYEALALAANMSIRSAARGLARLREHKIVNWVRRCREDQDEESGRWILRQETNAYAIRPATQWEGYKPPPEIPPPDRETWGAAPIMPADGLAQAVEELRAGASVDAINASLARGDSILGSAIARLALKRK